MIDCTKKLHDTDIVGVLQPYVDRKILNYQFVGDDSIHFFSGTQTDTPWLIHKGVTGHHCHIWQTIYFNVFGVVPQFCFKHCYKVTACNKGMDGDCVRQLTMEEVMGIHEVQKELDLPSKCGMDRREFTTSIWGAFWYFGSIKHAQQYYDKIAKAVHDKVNPEIELNIKRSCTEYELALGPSDKWDSLDIEWKHVEDVLDKWTFWPPEPPKQQNELVQQATKIRMMYWAHKHGDLTYKKFNEGNDLIHRRSCWTEEPMVPSKTYNP